MRKLSLHGGQLAEAKVKATRPTRGDPGTEDNANELSHHAGPQKGQLNEDTPATWGSGWALGAYWQMFEAPHLSPGHSDEPGLWHIPKPCWWQVGGKRGLEGAGKLT